MGIGFYIDQTSTNNLTMWYVSYIHKESDYSDKYYRGVQVCLGDTELVVAMIKALLEHNDRLIRDQKEKGNN